ncbi:MAG: hypothetical protein HFJ27_04565 [Clostridia bacterium]|nr:hypothetical protein [Clostridia bacterium]
MNYKVEGALRRNKKNFIIFLILWIILAIVLVMPISYSITKATIDGQFMMDKFFGGIATAFTDFGKTIGSIFTKDYIGTYFSTLFKFSILYAIFVLVGLIKTAPKHEFADIEHGSSDWSKNGEQYRVLSDRKGIILAQNNYLPLDKRGNVNVLVVGRIRIW